jgi:hypothetical protein
MPAEQAKEYYYEEGKIFGRNHGRITDGWRIDSGRLPYQHMLKKRILLQ